jgi:RimJ/RimL family protein N-acetyltransferase
MQTTLSNSLVTIRRYDAVDVLLLFEAARESSAEVSVWLPWCHSDYSMEQSLEWVLRSGKQWDDGREFHFGIFHSPSGAFVGGVGLNELKPEHRLANLGYWVRSAWAGRGVATAAARLAAQFGFEELLLDRIEILAALGNKGSQRVAQKLGALKEGVLRNRLVIHGQAHDAVVFSLIGSEWKPSDKLPPLRRGEAESIVPSRESRGKEEQRMEMISKPAMNFAPVALEGQYARLEPLEPKHAEGLFAIGQDEEIWRYLLRPRLESVPDALGFVEEALRVAATGSQLPFAIIDQKSNQVAGSTRYLDIRPHDRAIEIGSTWLGSNYQRTAINSECKYLLLRHAFEELGAVRVTLKTDGRNEQSQRAIERLGAVREGVLRKHMVMWDGYVRDTVYYSILDDEWPRVKNRLEGLLSRS